MFYDDDADLGQLAGKTVAVIGFGSQGHAHALNLHDSGVSVVVGLRADSASAPKAREAGIEVLSVADAAAKADLIMILTPDEHQAALYRDEIAPGLRDGNMVLFAHGFSVHFGQVVAPKGVDVAMVAPKGPGHLVRRTYAEGAGHARPRGRSPGRLGQRQGTRPGLRQGHWLHPRGRDRDDLRRGGRDRPLR